MSFKVRIRVTIPKEIFNSQAAVDRITSAMRDKTAPALTDLFKQTVNEWRNAPEFDNQLTVEPSRIAMAVFPQTGQRADQYRLVNNGSPAHDIYPRNYNFLRFRPGYQAGTRPGSLQSSAFVRSGNYVATTAVHHPGFEAREFTKTIAATHHDQFVQDMQDAMKP